MVEENQRVRLTKRLLKEALIDLLETEPLQKVSVSELCKAAGINRTTFYNHYGNPADVLDDVEHDVFEEIQELLKREGQPLTLARRVEIIASYLREHARISKTAFASEATPSELALALFQLRLGQEGEIAAAFSRYGQSTRKLLQVFLENGIYSLVRTWLLDDVPISPKELGELAEKVALQGWAH
ncbi:MAG: TetR/AcrR family transcriptional regulator [Tractidigestivibacter sp.]|jgi:AcrR family transcriptional regulator|uniref:TetR/AcrR family transcriptional regulator n=1 Tax=Tractidigestivibacter sp. TaxID=2847320 RepID=UPI003D8F4D46